MMIPFDEDIEEEEDRLQIIGKSFLLPVLACLLAGVFFALKLKYIFVDRSFTFIVAVSVTRLGDLLDFGQVFKSLWQELICPNLSSSEIILWQLL